MQNGVERSFLNLASNDYLALSREKEMVEVSSQPSSRLLGGNSCEHTAFEELLAEAWGFGASLFYPTGYMANIGVLACLPQKGDLVLLDRLCHASLIDGVRLSRAEWKRYRHLDLEHLEAQLKAYSGSGQIWVVTESLFSMDGDLPNAQALAELKARYGFFLLVDEAHGVGVYGPQGRGWFAEQGVLEAVDIVTFNFSKSFALQGGVVLGSSNLKRHLVAHSRTQIFTTATPTSHWALLPKRLKLLQEAEASREHLKTLSLECATQLGLKSTFSPIVPYHVGEATRALELFEGLWEKGYYCPAILPPTVPEGGARLRLSLNASHQLEDILAFSRVLKELEVH
jgi:8-amino-7-oxononanoate synthase